MRRPTTSPLALALAAAFAVAAAGASPPALANGRTVAKKKGDDKAAEATGPAAAPAAPPPASSSPMADLKKSNTQLQKLLAKKAPNWSPEAEAQKSEVRKVVGNFLDFGELGRRSLARHWDGLAANQREEFIATLRELVENAYLKQMRGSAEYDLKFEKEQRDNGEATVDATLRTTARGKKVNVALEYKLLWKDSRWLVYDVITDEQSLLENYRAEFNKIINKESFDALMKRMKKKLNERDKDEK